MNSNPLRIRRGNPTPEQLARGFRDAERYPAKARSAPRPFTRSEVADFLAFADGVLAAPPAKPWIERYPGRGRLVLRFALPLAMAAPQNRSRHAEGWQRARERSSVLAAMAGQMADQVKDPDGVIRVRLGWCKNGRGVLPVWHEPLSGRPMVRAIRFSSVAPDATAAWHKVVVDCLRVPRGRAGKMVPGLGVLVDDRPSVLELREWWEPAARGQGGALIEVYDGEEENNHG